VPRVDDNWTGFSRWRFSLSRQVSAFTAENPQAEGLFYLKPMLTLQLSYSDAVATITLNRPEKRNAISAEMIAELLASFDEVETSPAQALIITGSGKAFCSGMDLDALKALATQSPQQHLEDARTLARLCRRLWSFPKPTIAAVNGHAIAGGCGIATLCDLTIAVPEAKFGYPEVRIGFLPAVVSIFLVRQIGEKQARDLLLTGKTIDAAEALRLGLITQIAPPEELMKAAHDLAATLLASSPTSLRVTKKLLCDFAAPEIDRELELAIAESAQIRATPDFREGLASFLEKRAPRWSSK
jgi:methylglutaconyl-CoA hydratase